MPGNLRTFPAPEQATDHRPFVMTRSSGSLWPQPIGVAARDGDNLVKRHTKIRLTERSNYVLPRRSNDISIPVHLIRLGCVAFCVAFWTGLAILLFG